MSSATLSEAVVHATITEVRAVGTITEPTVAATITEAGDVAATITSVVIAGSVSEQRIAGSVSEQVIRATISGAPGPSGAAATVTAGTTTTGAPGTAASVVNSGTSSAAVLDFTIPRGADGADGADGAPGAPGAAATVTVGSTTTGAAGSSATVTNSGTTSAAVLEFTIPRGNAGATGPAGVVAASSPLAYDAGTQTVSLGTTGPGAGSVGGATSGLVLTLDAWGRITAATATAITPAAIGAVPTGRTLTINGTAYDLSADRSWTISGTVYDTEAALLATSPAAGTLGIASDTYAVLLRVGSAWYKLPFAAIAEPTSPDMGYTQASSRIGYYATTITDKTLANCRVGGSALTSMGAVRSTTVGSTETLQVYLNSGWRTVVSGVTMRELLSNSYALEHDPEGNLLGDWINVFSGNGNILGLNGRPLIQQYRVSMGAYPSVWQTVIDGGTF